MWGAPLPGLDGQVDPYARGVAAMEAEGIASVAATSAKGP